MIFCLNVMKFKSLCLKIRLLNLYHFASNALKCSTTGMWPFRLRPTIHLMRLQWWTLEVHLQEYPNICLSKTGLRYVTLHIEWTAWAFHCLFVYHCDELGLSDSDFTLKFRTTLDYLSEVPEFFLSLLTVFNLFLCLKNWSIHPSRLWRSSFDGKTERIDWTGSWSLENETSSCWVIYTNA
jgi:hypothetical protein